jgi:DNA-binding CsgD family transcriptional regulator
VIVQDGGAIQQTANKITTISGSGTVVSVKTGGTFKHTTTASGTQYIAVGAAVGDDATLSVDGGTVSVYENSNRIFEALSAGACGYLLKSTPLEQLLVAIEDIHSGGSPRSSSIARKVVQAFHPSAQATPLIEQLSPREQQVLNWLAEGFAYKQIAAEMNLSMGTIRTYIRSMYEKLHVNSRTEAVVKYLDAAGLGARASRRD